MSARRVALFGTLAAISISPGAGCKCLEDKIQGEIDRYREAATGEIPEEPPILEADPIQVNSVLPGRGETTGGLLVEIVGLGFEPGMRVFFGDVEADPSQVDVLTESRIQLITPPAPVGWANVFVAESETRFGALENGFEYYEPVTIETVAPVRGPSAGGEDVIIEGTGFIEGTLVRFGTAAAVTGVVVHAHKLQVSAPPLPRDTYAVTVSNNNGSATLPAAYTTWDPVRATNLLPFAGPIGGGTPVVAYGTGFIDGSTVTLGGQSLAAAGVSDETELSAITLPAAPPVEGAVDLTVENENGTSTLRDAFVFVDTGDGTPRVVSVSPGTGLIDGGREIHIVGAGFDDSATEVTFGATAAACTVLSDNAITCLSPPAPEGVVDVRVTNPGMDETLVAGFKYIELRLDLVLPSRGAIAGNTWVDVWGNGFGGDTELFLDGLPAQAVAVNNDDRLSFRTPRHNSGVVDVRVVTQGVELTFPELFTYFQPYDSDYWSSGASVDGAVNVTVIDWDTNERLEGAFVMLGIDAETRYQGFTNDRGQITLSGHDVRGPQTVTAGKLEYANFSWIDVNAENLTLSLMPYPPPIDPQFGSGPPPPVIRGTVERIKDEYNLGNDIVLVSSTYQSFSVPLPNPGPGSQMINQGEYELWARTGDMVVMAYAGTPGPENALITNALGFAPFVFTEVGSGDECESDNDCAPEESCYDYAGNSDPVCTRIYEGVDILIDTPLKQDFDIQLDDPPMAESEVDWGRVPDTAWAFTYYDFGYMGLLPMAEAVVPFSDRVVLQMPRELPGPLAGTPFFTQTGMFFGWDSDGLPETPPALRPPQTETRLPALTSTRQPVLATPMLGTSLEVEPLYGGPIADPMRFVFETNKEVLEDGFLHVQFLDGQLITWLTMAPGHVREFTLPILPDVVSELRMLPNTFEEPHVYYWQMMGMYSPGLEFNHLDPFVFFNWRSRSIYNTYFYVPDWL